MHSEMMFVAPDAEFDWVERLLGPFEECNGPYVSLSPAWTMAHVMHAAGGFDSVGQAKKNGWNTPVPPGYLRTLVKKQTAVFTVRAMPEDDTEEDDTEEDIGEPFYMRYTPEERRAFARSILHLRQPEKFSPESARRAYLRVLAELGREPTEYLLRQADTAYARAFVLPYERARAEKET